MERTPDRKEGNLMVYYKDGCVMFDGSVNSDFIVEKGNWYYPNNQLYYSGDFDEFGSINGEDCTLFYENGDKKYVGPIVKNCIQILLEIDGTQKLNYKIDFGKQNISDFTKTDSIADIPLGGLSFRFKRDDQCQSIIVRQVFAKDEYFLFCGNVVNGKLQGETNLYYLTKEELETSNLVQTSEGQAETQKGEILDIDNFADRNLFFHGNLVKNCINGNVKFYQNRVETKPKPILIGNISDGLQNGFGEIYYPNSKKFFKGDWENDLPTGTKNVGYHDTGLKFFDGEFDTEGGKNVTIYYRNGKEKIFTGRTTPLDIAKRTINKLHGISFDRLTGKKKCNGHWLNEKLEGEGIEMFDSNEILMSVGTYKSGNLLTSKEYYTDRTLKLEANWAGHNKMTGIVRKYDEKGNLTWDGNYELGLKSGSGIEYYGVEQTGGKPMMKKVEGFWKKGKIDGDDIKLYDSKGVLRFCGEFSEGQKWGVGKQYHSNGVLEFESDFKDGRLNGRFVRMFSDMGFPVFEGGYMNGYRYGFGKVYDNDGKLRVFGYFYDGSHGVMKSKPYFVRNGEGKFVDNMGMIVY